MLEEELTRISSQDCHIQASWDYALSLRRGEELERRGEELERRCQEREQQLATVAAELAELRQRRHSSVETRLSSVEEDLTMLIAWQREAEQREAGARGGAGGCRWRGPPPGLAAVKKESGSLW